jgi:hypothetical protein
MLVSLDARAVQSGALSVVALQRVLSAGGAVRSAVNLHAKLVVVDDRWALVGSGNLTAGGVNGGNAELGVEVLMGASEVRAVFDRWWAEVGPEAQVDAGTLHRFAAFVPEAITATPHALPAFGVRLMAKWASLPLAPVPLTPGGQGAGSPAIEVIVQPHNVAHGSLGIARADAGFFPVDAYAGPRLEPGRTVPIELELDGIAHETDIAADKMIFRRRGPWRVFLRRSRRRGGRRHRHRASGAPEVPHRPSPCRFPAGAVAGSARRCKPALCLVRVEAGRRHRARRSLRRPCALRHTPRQAPRPVRRVVG